MPTDPARAANRPPPTLAIDIDVQTHGWTDTLSDIDARAERDLRATWSRLQYPERRYEVSVVLADDATQRDLNSRFRGKDAATNVLSFESGVDTAAVPPDEPVPLGDIVLALETMTRESRDLNLPLEDHFSHLLVHGMLHLAGFDHQTEQDAEEMENLEIDVLASLGIGNPYVSDDPSDREP